jgi:eukaryotic-like serine/threonine-protein kinase
MTPDRWQRLDRLFQSALEHETPQRGAFLDRACAGDSDLRRDVESLLLAHAGAGGFLESGRTALEAGARLGRYEIKGPLGAGGMGEVYRAWDEGLGREVAVKVLPRGAGYDPDRLRRFEQEARAVGRLNHPHVLAVYDAGQQDGAPFIVCELLEGHTLRERLKDGPLPASRAADLTAQAARGLAAAHAQGIVHRDLKPENLFVTRDGRVKVLDFGLAKVGPAAGYGAPPSARTASGVLLGTLGYMAPEQARGETADHRSDIFALGAILCEMLTGRAPFRRATVAETLGAILRDDPAAELQGAPGVPDGLALVAGHCLEKQPDERFQSASDLAFQLDALAGSRTGPVVTPPGRKRRAAWVALLAVPLLAAAAFLAGQRWTERALPTFRQLTFRRGLLTEARFSRDGYTIFYSAAWDGRPAELFAMRLDGVETRALGVSGRILATARGEMAVLTSSGGRSVVVRRPLEGGAAREVFEDVLDADWDPAGGSFVLVRRTADRATLEFPAGRAVYTTAGNIESPRLSPRGDLVAFFDRPMLGNTPGTLLTVDRAGKVATLSAGWMDTGGVAWPPDGSEVWFTAAREGTNRSLHAATLTGRTRLLAEVPGTLVLHDISPAGTALVSHVSQRNEAFGLLAGDTRERDLSWYDWTHATELLPDGRGLLFTAEGAGGGPLYSIYLRRDPDAAPVRLGDGHGTEVSPDGSRVLAMVRRDPPQLLALPTGVGQPAPLAANPAFVEYHWAWWFPDGRRALYLAHQRGQSPQLFVHDLSGGGARPLAPQGVTAYRHKPISPDGRDVLALAPGDPQPRFLLYPVDGGPPRPVPGLAAADVPVRWSGDGRHLFVRAPGDGLPVRVDRVEVATGRRERWRELAPADPAGVRRIGDVVFSADGRSYVYNCGRDLSELFLAEGVR